MKKLFNRGLELKEEIFGAKAGFITPREVSPIMPIWFFTVGLLIASAFLLDIWGFLTVGAMWCFLNYAFFNAQVKL